MLWVQPRGKFSSTSPTQMNGCYTSLSFSMRPAQENLLLECALSEITYQTFALKEQLVQNISLAIFALPSWGEEWLFCLSAYFLQQPFSRPGCCFLLQSSFPSLGFPCHKANVMYESLSTVSCHETELPRGAKLLCSLLPPPPSLHTSWASIMATAYWHEDPHQAFHASSSLPLLGGRPQETSSFSNLHTTTFLSVTSVFPLALLGLQPFPPKTVHVHCPPPSPQKTRRNS